MSLSVFHGNTRNSYPEQIILKNKAITLPKGTICQNLKPKTQKGKKAKKRKKDCMPANTIVKQTFKQEANLWTKINITIFPQNKTVPIPKHRTQALLNFPLAVPSQILFSPKIQSFFVNPIFPSSTPPKS